MLLTTVVAFAGKESLYVLHEGFEEGIPATWTQECISGQVSWAAEQSGASMYPESAFDGNGLVALRNTTGQTQHFATKLVTPVIDLSEVFQPILVFSHAQMLNAGDVDVLKVYYRTAADVRWVEIGNYENKTKGWKTDTIRLTAPSATYQLAFEGIDKFGRGVALDEVIVRPMPTCNDPSNISADGLTVNSALLRWNGSLDTDSFRIVLSTTEQTNMESMTDVVADTFVSNFEWQVKDLIRFTRYYVYVQAYCGEAESEWAKYTFTTKNMVDLPYTENFNKQYAQGTVSAVPYWTHGTSILDEEGKMLLLPYINSNVSKEASLKECSYSKTTALVFNGAITSGASNEVLVPAGHYVYAATPEINVESVAKLQATFWGNSYDYTCDAFMASLVVGVMTDPADFSTFVAVDTVRVKEYRTHQRFTVNFDSYKGDGKYIAFASNFQEKSNVFYMDDLTIEEMGVKEVSDLEITNCLGARFDVNANLNGNQQIQLIVAKDSVDMANDGALFWDPTIMPQSAIYCDKVLSASELPYTVQLPEGGKIVQVYMRAVSGTEVSKFTTPKKVLVPQKFTEKIFVDFETSEGANIWKPAQLSYFSTTTVYDYPFPYSIVSSPQKFTTATPRYPYAYVSTSTSQKPGYNSMGYVQLAKEKMSGSTVCECGYDQVVGDYIALPEVEDLKTVYLSFYMKYYSTKGNSNMAVGVMSDPFDPATFDTLAIFANNEDEWKPVVVTFDKYTGKGKFPALMAIDAPGASGSYISAQAVDDIVLDIKPDCMEPTNIQAEVNGNTIKLTWDENGMTEWVANLYTDAEGTKKVDSAIVTTGTHTFTNLKYHTYYYYGVSTKCDTTLTEAFLERATTPCATTEALPFIEDFEGWDGGEMNPVTEPLCWVIPRYEASSGIYPFINASGSNAYKGKANIQLYAASTAKPTQDLYAALPEMAEDLNKLQIKFYARPAGPAYIGNYLYVGVMSDPNDLATFDTVAAVKMISDKYTDYLVPFNDYTGTGKYIALMNPLANSTQGIYIDDIIVDYLSDCPKVYGVEARNTTPIGADIRWTKGAAVKWEVLLATDTMTLGSIVDVDGVKVLSINATDKMPYSITNCPTANQQYYVYVRAICDENNKGEWSNPLSFETTCYPTSAGDLGIIDFKAEKSIDCWIVGMRDGATPNNLPKISSEKLVISNATTTDGAYAIMPTMDIDSIKRLQIEFDAHGGTDAKYLRELTVGVITNPSDLSTFVKMVTLTLPLASKTADQGEHFTVRFADYVGDYNGDYGKNIMFISESGNLNNDIYLDNVRVDTTGSCVEPLLVNAIEANTNDLTISWEKLPSNKYQFQFLNEKQDQVLVDTILVDTTAIKVDGLTMLTSYYAKVRQICSETDSSVWSVPALVQTVCPEFYPLPYSENFDSYANSTASIKYQPDCWEVMHNYTGTTVANTPCVYSSAKVGSSGYGYNIYSSASQYAYVVLPKLEGKIGEMMISFDYRSNNSSNDQYFMIAAATDVTSVEDIEATMTVIDTVNMPAYKDPNKVWYYYSGSLSAYEGEGGNIVLVAKGVNQKTFIDNIIVEKAPTCFRPIGLTVGEITKTSVELSWTAMGKETAWDVETVNLATQETTITTVTTNPAVITNLQHSTDYQFNVRANCGSDDVSDWTTSPVTATTVYFVELADAKWNFDNPAKQYQSPHNTSATYKLEKGWIVNNEGASATYIPYSIKNTYNTNGTINKHYAKSDSCALKLNSYVYITTSSSSTKINNKAYAALPEINANYDDLQVRFWGRGVNALGSKVQNVDSIYEKTANATHAVKVGTMLDPNDFSTFTALTEYRFKNVEDLTTVVEDGHWEEVIVPLYGATGKYIALVADNDTTSVVYVDDLVVEEVTGCPVPNFVKADVVKYNTATFSWKSAMNQWEVVLTEQGKSDVVDQAIVSEATWTSTKVEPSTNYQLKVRVVCGEAEYSAWRTCDFATPCEPVATSEQFVYTFEEEATYEVTADSKCSYRMPDCWIQGKMVERVQPVVTYTNTIITNLWNGTYQYQYSRNKLGDNQKNAALRLYNYISTSAGNYDDSYVILPEVNFNVDSMNLHFWARAAYFVAPDYKTNANKMGATNNNYQKSLVIGAIADVNDLSTFVPLDTFTYSALSVSSTNNVYSYNDPAGNEYWQEVIIPLKEYQGKGRIMMYYPSNGKTSMMFIDDLEIVFGDFCLAASGLAATNVTATAATLNWKVVGNDSVALQVATDVNFTAPLLVDTILTGANGVYQLSELNPGTTYYYQVQHICSPEQSADWTISSFTTLYAVRFYENFSKVQLCPDNWARAKDLPELIFNGKKFNYNDATITANWYRTTDCVFAPAAMRTYTAKSYANTENHWLLTPVIDLTYTDTNNPLMLSLQLGLSSNEGGDVRPHATAAGDKFLIAVSVDGGKTWSADNTFWWSDVKEDNPVYAYSEIPYEGKTFAVDMTKYVGKQVMLGFVSYSDKTNSDNYIYLANVSINGTVINSYASSICQWNDYDDENFYIDAYDLVLGETTTYSTYVQAKEADAFTTMDLTVDVAATTTFKATICEGESYTLDNFDIQNAVASGVYKQKLEGTNTCDSVVVLNLTVMPKLYTTVEETICQGNYYEFGGMKYYTSTIISDTLSSVVTGCDSIVTLYLTVNAILEGEEEIHLCPTDSIEFGKFGLITEAGTYVDTLQTALMCDSVVTWNVFRHEAADTLIRAAICQGESYSQDVWVGLTQAGVYPSEQKTVWGCDSIVTLDLLVAGADLIINDTIEVDELPYVLNGEELLPVGTEIGVYTKTINLSCGEATVVIMVGQLTDINSVFTNSLALAPNLVGVGQETMVYGSFASDAVLEVYHTTGALVYRSANTNVVPGLPTAGVYMVTVKSNNQMYQSMLIVQ